MNNQAVEKIILSGEDSIRFANSLFLLRGIEIYLVL